jgi:hypothetical protein
MKNNFSQKTGKIAISILFQGWSNLNLGFWYNYFVKKINKLKHPRGERVSMKKLFWIPLFVILTVIPMIAGAAPVAGEPVAGNATSPTAIDTPKYALKGAGAGDEKAALASYVKGAYNAVIKGINNTQDEINTLNSGITTYRNAIGHLTDGKATQDGTVATIKNATTTESINTSSVNITGVTTTSISATASGNVNLVVPIMDDWENDSLAENPVQTTARFTNLPVENLAMSAPTSNTATLTKTGIIGNVDVSGYTGKNLFDISDLYTVGTPTVTTAGVYTTTSSQNYVRTEQVVPFSTANSWSFKWKFVYEGAYTDQGIMSGNGKTNIQAIINSAGKPRFSVGDGTDWQVIWNDSSLAFAYQNGVSYDNEIYFDGTRYGFKVNGTEIGGVDSTFKAANTYFAIGVERQRTSTQYTRCTWDLSQTSLVVDGVEQFPWLKP